MGRKKIYTDEELKERRKEWNRKYALKNIEKIKSKNIKWRKNNPVMDRAKNILSAYNQKDALYGRGKGDLTAKWIVENIFSKPCAHCGKEGWKVIGCNRLDNTKPHSKDNVEPCCLECNLKLAVEDKLKRATQK